MDKSLTTIDHHWKILEVELAKTVPPETIEAFKNIFYAGAAAYETALQMVLRIEDKDIGRAALDALENEISAHYSLPKNPLESRIILP